MNRSTFTSATILLHVWEGRIVPVKRDTQGSYADNALAFLKTGPTMLVVAPVAVNSASPKVSLF